MTENFENFINELTDFLKERENFQWNIITFKDGIAHIEITYLTLERLDELGKEPIMEIPVKGTIITQYGYENTIISFRVTQEEWEKSNEEERRKIRRKVSTFPHFFTVRKD